MEKNTTEISRYPEWANLKNFSWTAIIAGSLAALAVSFMLNTLGVGIGLSAFTTNTGVLAYAIGGFLWFVVSTFIAMAVGGVIAGLLVRRDYKAFGGSLHGFLVWALGSILTFMVIGTVMIPAIAGATAGTASNPVAAKQLQAGTASTPVNIQENRQGTDVVTATHETEKTLNYTGGISLLTFCCMLFGLVGALLGARVGVKEDLNRT